MSSPLPVVMCRRRSRRSPSSLPEPPIVIVSAPPIVRIGRVEEAGQPVGAPAGLAVVAEDDVVAVGDRDRVLVGTAEDDVVARPQRDRDPCRRSPGVIVVTRPTVSGSVPKRSVSDEAARIMPLSPSTIAVPAPPVIVSLPWPPTTIALPAAERDRVVATVARCRSRPRRRCRRRSCRRRTSRSA